MAVYTGFTGTGDPGGGRNTTQFYAFDALAHANAINALQNAQPTSGLFSARPAPGNLNALYYSQDNNVVYQDNGTSWVKIRIGGDACSAMGDVPTTGWTAVNMQAGASWASDLDAMLFTIPSTGSTDNIQYQYRAYPTPPFTLTVYLDVDIQIANGLGSFGGLGIAISNGTAYTSFGPHMVPSGQTAAWGGVGWNIAAVKWTNATTYSASYLNAIPMSQLTYFPHWWRFADDNTNRKLSVSQNGIEWHSIFSVARTDFLTPTRIGLYANSYTGAPILARYRSWNGVA